MSIQQHLHTEFQQVNVIANEKILSKCEELCSNYDIHPEDFVELWLAYAASTDRVLHPTIEALDRMERKELKKQGRQNKTLNHSKTVEVDNTVVECPPESPKVSHKEEYISHNVPSENFNNRSDPGNVVQRYGESGPDNFKTRCTETLSIKVLNIPIGKSLYMCEKFLTRRESLLNMSRWAVKDILGHHKLELTPKKLRDFSGEMTICGRICSENDGKLDLSSIILEGLPKLYRGQRVRLSLNNVEKVRLFKGQSVVVTGNNMKKFFVAKEVYTGAPLSPPLSSPELDSNMQIMIAAGPYTLLDNLLFEPLRVLLQYALEYRPNVLILMGPFLDKTHPHLENFPEYYDTFFENIIDGLVNHLKGNDIQIILVPSSKDIHNHVIFPTLPYKLKKHHANLHLAPDPFLLNVSGLVIGGSTADILFHLNKNECAKGTFGDRIGHIISHVFNQRNFYPLYPPDSELRVDYHLLEEYAMLDTTPHIMILPSNFRHFVKVIENCVVINPERLIKGNGGGTFAKVEVRAPAHGTKLADRISCVIQSV